MGYNKPQKPMSGGIIHHEPPMPHRDEGAVRAIIGVARKAVQVGTAFFDWPIWQRYPTWHQFQKSIAEEREQAEKEGREPHSACQPPGILPSERREMELGPAKPRPVWRPMGKNLGPKHPVKNSIKARKA
jgi:hypothetical protein